MTKQAMRITRQGVRNLDPPRQANERKRQRDVGCFHVFVHDRDCERCWDINEPQEMPCLRICSRCGARP